MLYVTTMFINFWH